MLSNLDKKVKVGCIQAILVDCINKKLFGEVMTIIDASISDVESRRAAKSLVSQSFTRVSRQFVFDLNNLQEVK